MKPLNRACLTSIEVEKLLSQQIAVAVSSVGNKIAWLKAYFFEDKGVYKLRYEVVSTKDIVLSTIDREKAIEKFMEISEPLPVQKDWDGTAISEDAMVPNPSNRQHISYTLGS